MNPSVFLERQATKPKKGFNVSWQGLCVSRPLKSSGHQGVTSKPKGTWSRQPQTCRRSRGDRKECEHQKCIPGACEGETRECNKKPEIHLLWHLKKRNLYRHPLKDLYPCQLCGVEKCKAIHVTEKMHMLINSFASLQLFRNKFQEDTNKGISIWNVLHPHNKAAEKK